MANTTASTGTTAATATAEKKPVTDAPADAKNGTDASSDGRKRQEEAEADTKKRQEEAEKLRAEHGKLAAEAAKDRAEAESGKLTPEQLKANESAKKADDAAAKAAEAERAARGTIAPATVEEAKVNAPVDPYMPAGSHWAQKFGNDPANPKPALGVHEDPEFKTVRLSRISPDHEGGLVHTSCHPDMTGDYMRAGWSLDEVQAGTYPLTKDEQAEADKREVAEKRVTPAA